MFLNKVVYVFDSMMDWFVAVAVTNNVPISFKS